MEEEQLLMDELKREGFSLVYVHEDAPNAVYPNHVHESLTAHILLEGEMDVKSNGKTKHYQKGDRFDVPPKEIHSAKIGPEGCKYIIGDECK